MTPGLDGRRVVVGVTGGIAVYKMCDVVRRCVTAGAAVRVVMTESATRLIQPLLFEQLSGNTVGVGMFDEHRCEPGHVSLADWAELVVVAPCSCNTIAKLTTGKTEDLLTAVVYAATGRCPVVLFPSMNDGMWNHPITRRNVGILREIGYTVVDPDAGELLCGRSGAGRLPEPSRIVETIASALAASR
jgi:phosphopantothenoylcysteine decarboxylase/phosphopantothenate--cysteine ligase